MSGGACERCGETYRDEDFGVDHDGYLVELHTCDGRAVERRDEKLERYQQRARVVLLCKRCGIEITAFTRRKDHCASCAQEIKRERDAERWRRRRGAA